MLELMSLHNFSLNIRITSESLIKLNMIMDICQECSDDLIDWVLRRRKYEL